jgi:hypothetical protein
MNQSETLSVACCASMLKQLNWKCGDHASPADCPDALVGRFGEKEDFGLFIHDGGCSYVEIAHCPWCGTSLRQDDVVTTQSPVHEIADGDVVLWSVEDTVHINTINKHNDPVERSEQDSLELSQLLARLVKDG